MVFASFLVKTLNKNFNSTAERILECSPSNKDDLFKTVEGLQCQDNSFTLAPVTQNEVLNTIKLPRSDCSTGPDQIPTQFIKPIAEFLASPLCHIINTCIQSSAFPTKWKTARISPIPKVDYLRANDDYRPVSILPVFSKIFERLVLNQIVAFIEKKQILNEKVCGFRKGHSTVTALLGIRDMIVQAMGRGEITLMVLADFSKAFDTIDYKTFLYKMHALKFSNSFLKWLVNYLHNRQKFVQVDDKMSELIQTRFGVPLGSILGPVLFNLYVTDLQGQIEQPCFQYADDTTIIVQGRPKNCCSLENAMNKDLMKPNSWSASANLALNPKKTKVMLLSTKQLSRHHNLDDFTPALKIGKQPIEHEKSPKLLGVILDQHLLWEDHINKITSSSFGALAIVEKFRNIMTLKLKKQVAELLILSKMDYADVVFHPLSLKLQKRLQRVENAAASFVLGCYVKEKDIISLGWLPMKERREWHLVKLAFNYITDHNKPAYIDISLKENSKFLRSNSAPQIATTTNSKILRNSAAKIFNTMPNAIRNSETKAEFSSKSKEYFLTEVKNGLLI